MVIPDIRLRRFYHCIIVEKFVSQGNKAIVDSNGEIKSRTNLNLIFKNNDFV